mgnify:CR=1 FL=1
MTPTVAPNAKNAAKPASNCDKRDRAADAEPPPLLPPPLLPPEPGRRDVDDGDSEAEGSELFPPSSPPPPPPPPPPPSFWVGCGLLSAVRDPTNDVCPAIDSRDVALAGVLNVSVSETDSK